MVYKAYHANVEVNGLDFGNIVAWNLKHNFTYIAAVELPTLLLMIFNTIMIVFTVMICSCTIMIMEILAIAQP